MWEKNVKKWGIGSFPAQKGGWTESKSEATGKIVGMWSSRDTILYSIVADPERLFQQILKSGVKGVDP